VVFIYDIKVTSGAYWKFVFIRRYFLPEAKNVMGENKRIRFDFMVIGYVTWRKLGLSVSFLIFSVVILRESMIVIQLMGGALC